MFKKIVFCLALVVCSSLCAATTQAGNLSGLNIAVPNRWTFADATARNNSIDPLTFATYSVNDIGKLAFQLSDSTFWRLADATPTWTGIGGGTGTVTSISTGTGLSGGTITTSGIRFTGRSMLGSIPWWS